MKILLSFFLLILVSHFSFTQDYKSEPITSEKPDDIKTLTEGKHHSGGFGAITFKASEFRNETIVMMGLRGGWVINRSVAVGLEAQGIIPTAKFENIDPDLGQRAVLLGGYGGLFVEPILFSNRVIHVTFPIASGAGWLGYHRDWESDRFRHGEDLIDDDVFWYIEPGMGMEINVTRRFRVHMGITKRFTQDLELVNGRSKDFDKLNYALGFKIGSF